MCQAFVIKCERDEELLTEVGKEKAWRYNRRKRRVHSLGGFQSFCHPAERSPEVCDMPALGRSTYFSSKRFKIPYIHFSFSLRAREQIYGSGYTTQYSLYHRYFIGSQGGQETWVTSLAPLQWKSPEPSSNSTWSPGAVLGAGCHDQCRGGGAVNSSKTFTLSINCKDSSWNPFWGVTVVTVPSCIASGFILCLQKFLWVTQ